MRIELLRVEVDGPVDALALASAIRHRLVGNSWPTGPERQVADAIRAVRDDVSGSGSGDHEARSC